MLKTRFRWDGMMLLDGSLLKNNVEGVAEETAHPAWW